MISEPTLAPRISSSALVVIVVPWEKNSMPREVDAAHGEIVDAAHDAERRIGRRRRNFFDSKRAVGDVEQHQVGMGAADVDAQPITLGHDHRSTECTPTPLMGKPERCQRRFPFRRLHDEEFAERLVVEIGNLRREQANLVCT